MYSKESRNLLYLNSSNTPSVMLNEMSDAGWNVKLASNLDSAANIIDKYSPR